MEKTIKKLVFVYNADSTLFAQISDGITKILAPNKYQCNLCMVTYGALSMKDEWRQFLETLPLQKEFYHKNEFHKKYSEYQNVALPSIFIENNKKLEVLISANELNQSHDIPGLKKLITGRLVQEKI